MPHGRASARFQAVRDAGARRPRKFERPLGTDGAPLRTSEYFGCATFSFELMEKRLPAADVAILKEFATSERTMSLELADMVAKAVKEWAMVKGATHYCHWFQPQTGTTAEKHDSFFSFDDNGGAIEKFGGKQLIQAEPDASSFPSGGVRATFEARGYTAWDASSPMFLMETENGLTLCIPSVFCSYGGQALDEKTPLLRSLARLSERAVESLALLGHDAKFVSTTAGPEQEYFLVDEALHNLRPDLLLAGRTLFGRTPPRHQQLEDHYFGSIKPRVLAFMIECETELYKLGVPVKTRHNEVAPSQCEAAPIFEHANVAADHNQLIMEVIKSVARRHRLVALFHEKPYAGINGSGKHVNWSMADSSGHNLLEPGDVPHENVRFLFFLSAVVKAIHDHGALLRMAVATPGNDFRLGANEAPPAIMSTFLGETLNEVLDKIESGAKGHLSERAREINLDLAKVPVIARDNTDRNRTSPFAFTGNKFEFRAVGASASISMPITFVNAAVADALTQMNERVRAKAGGARPSDEQVLEVVQQVVKETRKIRFEGDNYSADWHKEAAARGLPNLRTTPEALGVLKDAKVQALLSGLGIMTPDETMARYNVRLERFNKVRLIELELLQELVATCVLPAVIAHQTALAASVKALEAATGKAPQLQKQALESVATLGEGLVGAQAQLKAFLDKAGKSHDEEALGAALADQGMRLLGEIRLLCNDAELVVDDELWSLPKYREILYLQ
jgi:glutamine synthetase